MSSFDSSQHSTNCYRYCGCKVDQETSWYCYVGGICCGIICAIIFVGVMLGMSIQDINHDEIAVAYNNVTRDLGTATLTEGRHYLTPAHILLKFSNKLIARTSEISCVSADGMVIYVTASFQFQPKRNEIRAALYEFGSQDALIEVVLIALADLTKDLCGYFTGEEFFTNRSDIDLALSDNTTRVFTNTPIHIQPGFIQLRNIRLPFNFSQAIEQKQLALEDIDVATIQRDEIVITARTEQIQVEQQASIAVNQAQADARSIAFEAEATANATNLVWLRRAQAMLFDMNKLNMTASEYVQDYLMPHVLADATNARVQGCLQSCRAASVSANPNCWYCWVEITPTPVTI